MENGKGGKLKRREMEKWTWRKIVKWNKGRMEK